jgi:predicted unusual protein kinase regulating ubiquinone biosynthesis (AarF/ABC1/UbiB family)
LIARLCAEEFEGVLGAVHGDLHPKNIVIDGDEVARIIDFGWAQPASHIVIDYVLLDLNLRGTTLPSQLGEGEVLSLAGFLRPGQDKATLNGMARRRAEIIEQEIWARAQKSAVTDWEREYLVPMLLVGYGLLVHLDSARNQPALVATVLSLAGELELSVGAGASA